MDFTTFYERYGGAKKEIDIFYHGTPGKNKDPKQVSPVVKSILTQGLIPFPKKRNWDKDDAVSYANPSRVSYGGVYVTRNLGTATLAATHNAEQNESRVLVVMELQPRSLIADEDDLIFLNAGSLSELNHEYTLINLLITIRTGEYKDFYENVKEKYIKSVIKRIVERNKTSPQLQNRLSELLDRLFPITIERKIAHIVKSYFLNSSDYNFYVKKYGEEMLKPLSIPQAEKNYAQAIDQLTKTLKNFARSQDNEQYNFSDTGRSLQTIGFNGTNKIICILEYFSLHDEVSGTYSNPVYIRYGKPPDKLIQDWTNKRGEWNPIYAPRSSN